MATEDDFEIVCLYKDTNPSNLNEVFHSYGCSTLEAKAPVVNKTTVDQLMQESPELQHYATLKFKSKSGLNAIENRASRTRDRQLSMIEVNGETIITAGEVRERSPVDRDELDDELDSYMKETIRLKTMRLGTLTPRIKITNSNEDKHSVKSHGEISQKSLDSELDAYMKEAHRLKVQAQRLEKERDKELMEEFDREDETMRGGFGDFDDDL